MNDNRSDAAAAAALVITALVIFVLGLFAASGFVGMVFGAPLGWLMFSLIALFASIALLVTLFSRKNTK